MNFYVMNNDINKEFSPIEGTEEGLFEIMAPVGSRESLAAAIQAGADSVYFGIGKLNMRSHSANHFTIDDLRDIARECDEHGIKTYLTVNTIIYGEDIETMHEIVDAAHEAGISAVIASDIAVMTYCRKIGQEVHLSTQLNISNIEALRFYAQFADVVVLARELNMQQVADIYRQIVAEYLRSQRKTRSHRDVLSRSVMHGDKRQMLSLARQHNALCQPRGLHAVVSPLVYRHRPRDRHRTGGGQQVHHESKGLEDHPFHRQDDGCRRASFQDRGSRP